MKKTFTLLIISLILIVTISMLYNVIQDNKKQYFKNEIKNILELVGEKRLMTTDFDLGTINEYTLRTIIDIDSTNYESVKVTMVAEKVHIIIIGKNKWRGLTGCGTIEGISIVKGNTKCT